MCLISVVKDSEASDPMEHQGRQTGLWPFKPEYEDRPPSARRRWVALGTAPDRAKACPA